MKYRVRHITSYIYDENVSLCQNQVHLSPRDSDYQHCDSLRLTIEPQPSVMHGWLDAFGNSAHYFSIEVPHGELTVTAESEVVVEAPPQPPMVGSPPWETARDAVRALADDGAFLASQFTYNSQGVRASDEALAYARPSFSPGRPLLEAAFELTERIWCDFTFDKTASTVNTSVEETFRERRGVCQDFAHLQIACLRSMGLAARYVSGYLLTDPPPGQPKLVGADASHAWISVYCPRQGWLDFDPTNNQMPQLRHVTLGWGRDYNDVAPIRGLFLGGGDHRMSVSVDVAPADWP